MAGTREASERVAVRTREACNAVVAASDEEGMSLQAELHDFLAGALDVAFWEGDFGFAVAVVGVSRYSGRESEAAANWEYLRDADHASKAVSPAHSLSFISILPRIRVDRVDLWAITGYTKSGFTTVTPIDSVQEIIQETSLAGFSRRIGNIVDLVDRNRLWVDERVRKFDVDVRLSTVANAVSWDGRCTAVNGIYAWRCTLWDVWRVVFEIEVDVALGEGVVAFVDAHDVFGLAICGFRDVV